jgi:hypothetical protein
MDKAILQKWLKAGYTRMSCTLATPESRRGASFLGVGQHGSGWFGGDAGEEISHCKVDRPKDARGALCR